MASAKRIVCIIVIIVIVVIGVVCTFWLYHKKKKHKIPTEEQLKMEGGVEFYEQVLFSQLIKFKLPNLDRYNRIHFEFSENWNKQHLIKSFISGAKLFDNTSMYIVLNKGDTELKFQCNPGTNTTIKSTRRFILINYSNLKEVVSYILNGFNDYDILSNNLNNVFKDNETKFDNLIINTKIQTDLNNIRNFIETNITNYHILIINLNPSKINGEPSLNPSGFKYCKCGSETSLANYNTMVNKFIMSNAQSYGQSMGQYIDAYHRPKGDSIYNTPLYIYATHPHDDCVIEHKLAFMPEELMSNTELINNGLNNSLYFPFFQIYISGCGHKFKEGSNKAYNDQYATILFPNTRAQVEEIITNFFKNSSYCNNDLQKYINSVNNFQIFNYINDLCTNGIYYTTLMNNTIVYNKMKPSGGDDLKSVYGDKLFIEKLWKELTRVNSDLEKVQMRLNYFIRANAIEKKDRERGSSSLESSYDQIRDDVLMEIENYGDIEKANISPLIIILLVGVSNKQWKGVEINSESKLLNSRMHEFENIKYYINVIFSEYNKDGPLKNKIDTSLNEWNNLKSDVTNKQSIDHALSLLNTIRKKKADYDQIPLQRLAIRKPSKPTISNLFILVLLGNIYNEAMKKSIANNAFTKKLNNFESKKKNDPLYLQKYTNTTTIPASHPKIKITKGIKVVPKKIAFKK